MNRYLSLSLLAVALVLSGCAGIDTLNRVSTPNDLYALTPKSTFSSSLPRVSKQIVVEAPTATAAVDTDQVAVYPSPLRVQYLPGVRWVDRAPAIVQALMIESFENSGKVAAVSRSSVGLNPDYVILPDLREFQAYMPEGESEDGEQPLRINVRLNIKVVDEFYDRIIGSSSFEEVTISASDEMDDIAKAFDTALGKVMRKSVEWSIRTIHTHASKNPTPEVF